MRRPLAESCAVGQSSPSRSRRSSWARSSRWSLSATLLTALLLLSSPLSSRVYAQESSATTQPGSSGFDKLLPLARAGLSSSLSTDAYLTKLEQQIKSDAEQRRSEQSASEARYNKLLDQAVPLQTFFDNLSAFLGTGEVDETRRFTATMSAVSDLKSTVDAEESRLRTYRYFAWGGVGLGVGALGGGAVGGSQGALVGGASCAAVALVGRLIGDLTHLW